MPSQRHCIAGIPTVFPQDNIHTTACELAVTYNSPFQAPVAFCTSLLGDALRRAPDRNDHHAYRLHEVDVPSREALCRKRHIRGQQRCLRMRAIPRGSQRVHIRACRPPVCILSPLCPENHHGHAMQHVFKHQRRHGRPRHS